MLIDYFLQTSEVGSVYKRCQWWAILIYTETFMMRVRRTKSSLNIFLFNARMLIAGIYVSHWNTFLDRLFLLLYWIIFLCVDLFPTDYVPMWIYYSMWILLYTYCICRLPFYMWTYQLSHVIYLPATFCDMYV